jgi:hypothetical protein
VRFAAAVVTYERQVPTLIPADSRRGNERSDYRSRRSERIQAGQCDLLVFVGLHAGHADGADTLVLVHDR